MQISNNSDKIMNQPSSLPQQNSLITHQAPPNQICKQLIIEWNMKETLNILGHMDDVTKAFTCIAEWKVKELGVLINSPNVLKSISSISFPHLILISLPHNQITSVEMLNRVDMPGLKGLDLRGNRISRCGSLRALCSSLELCSFEVNPVLDLHCMQSFTFSRLGILYFSCDGMHPSPNFLFKLSAKLRRLGKQQHCSYGENSWGADGEVSQHVHSNQMIIYTYMMPLTYHHHISQIKDLSKFSADQYFESQVLEAVLAGMKQWSVREVLLPQGYSPLFLNVMLGVRWDKLRVLKLKVIGRIEMQELRKLELQSNLICFVGGMRKARLLFINSISLSDNFLTYPTEFSQIPSFQMNWITLQPALFSYHQCVNINWAAKLPALTMNYFWLESVKRIKQQKTEEKLKCKWKKVKFHDKRKV